MGAYRFLLETSPSFTLGAALEFTESDFREDFDAVWGLEANEPPPGVDHDDWLECRRVYGIAKQVADAGLRLVRTKGVGPQRLRAGDQLEEAARAHQRQLDELLQKVRDHLPAEAYAQVANAIDRASADDPRSHRAIFDNALQLAVIRLYPPTVDVAAQRLERLVQYAVASHNDRTNAFLGRVATCYCLDLRPEFAAMCRAVLDAALEEAVADDHVRNALGIARRDRIGLAARLQYLQQFDLVSEDVILAMRRLKDAGDNAVHVLPGLEPNPDDLLKDLIAALSATATIPRAQ